MFALLVDTQVDGLAVINAQGTVMMVNNATLGMFGYLKGELEGKNVSVLMPQPWSSRHESFLQVIIRVQRWLHPYYTFKVCWLQPAHRKFLWAGCVGIQFPTAGGHSS